MKEVKADKDKIFISLSYAPKAITLKRKFGNLPVRYMRTKLEQSQEFAVLEKLCKKFKFNLLDEENLPAIAAPATAAITSGKRKVTIEEVYSTSGSSSSSSSSSSSENEEEEVVQPQLALPSLPPQKKKRRSNPKKKTKSSAPHEQPQPTTSAKAAAPAATATLVSATTGAVDTAAVAAEQLQLLMQPQQ